MREGRAAADPATWRAEARRLLEDGVPPGRILWIEDGAPTLFGAAAPAAAPARAGPAVRVPRRFVALCEDVLRHRDPGRFDVLYRILWRLSRGEPRLLEIEADEDVFAARRLARAVARDAHHMQAFVRFRRVVDASGEAFVAWYQPEHRVLEKVAPFFCDRFAAMRWAILTPEGSIAWDGGALTRGPGVPRRAAPAEDELEELWCTYYAAVFNPARANPRLLRSKLPARHRPGLPEAAEIPALLANAGSRVAGMLGADVPGHVPRGAPLPVLREAAARCEACELCGPATQTVFGEGAPGAPIMLVGEQPGDEEDRRGRPFVGPAGQVLDAALRAAAIERSAVYLTNAVKHFRYNEQRGIRRIHQRPSAEHVRLCRPWLEAEIAAVRPRVLVCLGATAARALVGSHVRIERERGEVFSTRWAEALLVTYHPAAILRLSDARARQAAQLALVRDLARATSLAAG